jgi:hypothetical protein
VARPQGSRQTHRGRTTLIAVLILALVAGGVYWFTRDTSQPQKAANVSHSDYRDIGAGVSVSNGAPSGVCAAADSQVAKPPFQQVQQLSPVVHVTPDGPLAKPVTLRFKLNRKIDDPRDVVLAVNQTGKAGDWTLVMPSKVDANYAYYTTTHLSWWDPLWHDVTELVNAATAELKKQWDGLTDDAFAKAEQTKCDNEQEARDKGYSIKWSGAEALYWCLGLKDGKPAVRIANKRSYPIFINHKGIDAPGKPQGKFDLADALGRATFSNDRTVLMTADQLQLSYGLDKGQSKTFSTEYNGFAESVYQLEFGVTMLANILTRYGAVKGGTATQALSKLLLIKDCVGSLNFEGNVGRVISGCFDPAKIIEIFGWQGVLVAMVMIAAPIVKFFRNTFDTLGDLLQGKDQEKVTVSYNPPPPAKALFVGKWYVHGAQMAINKDGTGSYSWNAGPCTQSLDETRMCQGNAMVRFKVTSNSQMTGTYAKVWYATSDGSPLPSDFSGADPALTAGKTFTVKRNDQHTLITSASGGDNGPGNPYLCDEYAEMHNATTYQLCGA